nr:hypothetical protein [Tanacetum cinerariifolium]
MGEPLSPDRVFDFPEDESEPHPAYDFFAPGSLPGYAGNPNKNNVWLEMDDYLLGELEAMVDEKMVVHAVEEVADPVAEAEEKQMVAPEEVWEVNEEWLMAPVTPPSVPAVQPSSVYEVRGPCTMAAEGPSFPLPTPGLPIPPSVIEDLSTHLGNLEYRHGQLVKKVTHVSNAEVAAGVSIGEIGPRVFAIEGQVQIDPAGAGFAGCSAIERNADSSAADYGFGDEQSKNHAMSDKSSPLKRLVIEINVWVKLLEGENIFTLLRILMQVTLFLSTAWRESHAGHYDRVVPKRKYLRSFAYFSFLFSVYVVSIITFILGAVPPLLAIDHGGVGSRTSITEF